VVLRASRSSTHLNNPAGQVVHDGPTASLLGHSLARRVAVGPGALPIGDNRASTRIALGDFDPTRLRELHCTTVLGTPSGHVYAGLATPSIA
jgi:hypothetical protein